MNDDMPRSPDTSAAPDGDDAMEGSVADPLEGWDAERARCPVTRNAASGWNVLGHAEMLEVLHDHETFSNEVSAHLSVPNGMDPPAHGPYRAIVERYFGVEAMDAFEPRCRDIAVALLDPWIGRGGGDAVGDVGTPFAVRIQCAFMGWPDAMRNALAAWQDANHRATRAADRTATAEVARAFESRVGSILAERRNMGPDAPDDPTTRLMRERVFGRPLTEAEIVSIIRNWTAGELGTIAASLGILVHALAHEPKLQERLRGEPSLVPAFADEALRVRGPLVANRRIATRDVEFAGQSIHAGDRLRLLWPAANRDPAVFDDSGTVRLERKPDDNLLYGAGIHVCPGAPLARLELRVVVEELLERTSSIELDPDRDVLYAEPPKGGFERVPVRIDPR